MNDGGGRKRLLSRKLSQSQTGPARRETRRKESSERQKSTTRTAGQETQSTKRARKAAPSIIKAQKQPQPSHPTRNTTISKTDTDTNVSSPRDTTLGHQREHNHGSHTHLITMKMKSTHTRHPTPRMTRYNGTNAGLRMIDTHTKTRDPAVLVGEDGASWVQSRQH